MILVFVRTITMTALAASPDLLGTQVASCAASLSPPASISRSGASGAQPASLPDPSAPLVVKNARADSVVVSAHGAYAVKFASMAWTFTGNLAQDLADCKVGSGTDKIGDCTEITFAYSSAVKHSASIQLYKTSPIVIFGDTTQAEGPNDLAFLRWVTYPQMQSHLSFGNIFCTHNFRQFFDDDFVLFFNNNHDAFIISPAANCAISSMAARNGTISCGIHSSIRRLPEGFNHQVILAAQYNTITGF